MTLRPFGKVVRTGWGLTRAMRLTLALWGAAIPAWLLCGLGRSAYPTLAEHPFFAPLFWIFSAFFTAAVALWLVRRPSPRPPGRSGRTSMILWRLVAAALIALPTAWACAALYDPAACLANGMLSIGPSREEHAMVDRFGDEFVLDSPYWAPGFRWRVVHAKFVPPDLRVGSLAKITLRRGGLGAAWVEKIEYEVLK
jgi:hypothetical protein